MKRPLLIVLTIAFTLVSCEKILEKRLNKEWTLTELQTVVDSTRVNLLDSIYHNFMADAIDVQFFAGKNVKITILTDGKTDTVFLGTWYEKGVYDNFIFSDSLFLFKPDEQYEVINFERDELVLNGPFNWKGNTYEGCNYILKEK